MGGFVIIKYTGAAADTAIPYALEDKA